MNVWLSPTDPDDERYSDPYDDEPSGDEAEPLEDDHYPDDDEYEEIDEDEL